jgi:hypothetical protein
MLIGTYVRRGSYVTVTVLGLPVRTGREPEAAIVLERSERPGALSARVACEFGSLAEALRHAEGLVLSRAGALGAEAEALAGSPVDRRLARRLLTERGSGRFVHLTVRPPGGG